MRWQNWARRGRGRPAAATNDGEGGRAPEEEEVNPTLGSLPSHPHRSWGWGLRRVSSLMQ
jgi:hypothetical protein